MQRGVGLFGGTFDPVHRGHMALARAALRALGLARIDFLPAANPWQKHSYTDASHRVAMLRAAIEGEPRFLVNLTELERPGPTYTIDTLHDTRANLGSDVPLVLLLGGDQWENLETWRDWQAFTEFSHLAVCERAGRPLITTPAVRDWAEGKILDERSLGNSARGHIAFFTMSPDPASATQIRSLLQEKANDKAREMLSEWLPPEVLAYIHTHSLYSNTSFHG